MLELLYPALLVSTLLLLIPATVVAGHRRPNGAIAVSAGASLAASAIFWLVLGGPSTLYGGSTNTLVTALLFAGDLLMWIAAWTLALNAAAQARSWRWVALLTLCGPLSCFAFLVSLAPPQPCFFGLPQDFPGPGGPECPMAGPALQLLILALYLVAPAAALAYALRERLPRRRMRSRVSPLAASLGDDSDSDSDSELEVHSERL